MPKVLACFVPLKKALEGFGTVVSKRPRTVEMFWEQEWRLKYLIRGMHKGVFVALLRACLVPARLGMQLSPAPCPLCQAPRDDQHVERLQVGFLPRFAPR